MIKVRNGTPCKSGHYTASVNVVLDYGDKRGIIATGFLKWMFWDNAMGKWMVPSAPYGYGVKCKDIDEYLTELNNDKGIPYKVIRFECDGYIDDGETDHPSASTGKGDAVNSPPHYNMGGVECIDGIKAALGENYIGFLIGNVIKYCWRYKFKNGLEDIKKARYYLEKAIKELENV